MALAGGLLTVVMVMWHTMRRQKDKLAIPYGVAIAFGGLWVLATNYMPDAAMTAVSA
jgi:prepilin peptidase CpaA